MEKLTLLVTTDVHGSVYAHSYADGSIMESGLSRFSSAVKSYRKLGEVFVLDNGDILQGTPFLTVANRQTSEKHILSKVMNEIGYDYLNLGNHDFNYGYTLLDHYLNGINASCLTSNIRFNNDPLGNSQLVQTISGKTLALIGVCTDYIPHWEKPAHIKNIMFMDPVETVKVETHRLRNYADLIVVMYHGGLERDPKNGIPTERLTGENVGYQLAMIEGIDLLITGHQHRSFVSIISGTLVTQTASNAKEFAEITIEFGERKNIDAKIINLADYPIDQTIELIGETIEKQTQEWLDKPLGRLEGQLLKISDPFDARLHKHPLVSFINQIQLEVSGAQLSSSALSNDPLGFNPDVTYRDIVSNFIYPNTLVVKRISGVLLKEFLEKCAEYFSVKNDKIIVNPSFEEPKPQHSRYDMVDGIEYTIKVSNPIGERIIHLEYRGKQVSRDDTFTIVMNNYRAVGGGDFTMLPALETVAEINRDLTEILSEMIQQHKRYPVCHRENIQVTL